MLAYANRIRNGPVVIGLGVFAQGGMGADFKDLNTAFGTRDSVFSNIRYAKITPSVAYQLTDKISIGAALNMGYSDMEMKFFPNTFFPGGGGFPAFAGMRLRDVYSFGYGAKIGIMYSLSKQVTLGTVYTTKSVLDYDHGKITFQGPDPIGGTYAASVDGFNWPQSLGFGIGIRASERLLIAADITWVNWNDAMETVTIKTSNNTPGMDSIPFTMDWKDQTVIALGVSYKASEKLTVRAGYNFGRNPVPAENLSPLFPAITEHHITIGFGYKISNAWNIDAAWEHAFNKSVEYFNPSAPFGPNAVDEHNQNTAHLFLTYKF
jgi:long-chain fatty acid transport protein